MEVRIKEEAGYEWALRGMAYSYYDNSGDVEEWWEGQYPKAEKRAALLAHKGEGHSKFLESIQMWVDINATRAFWSEFDTYRAGMTKQSTSTMHTLAKRGPVPGDFEDAIDPIMFDAFCRVWEKSKSGITALKENLPEGFLQRRMCCTNYKTMQNIIKQREGHRYDRWSHFVDAVMINCQHPEFLVDFSKRVEK